MKPNETQEIYCRTNKAELLLLDILPLNVQSAESNNNGHRP